MTSTRTDVGRPVIPGIRGLWGDMSRLVTDAVRTVSLDDPGLFGPHSVAWRLHRDPASGIGGLRSLLLDALNPCVIYAAEQSGAFVRDPWGRALSSTNYIFQVTFSGTHAARRAGVRVRAIHSAIEEVEPASGRRFRADDPDLLLWVHCVTTDSNLAAYEAYAHALTPDDRDRYVHEMVRAAELVGLDPAIVPRTAAELRACIDETRGIAATSLAQDLLDDMVQARVPLTARPLWAQYVIGAIGLLPDRFRDMYRVPSWVPRGRATRRAIRASLRALNVSMLVIPAVRRGRRHLRSIEEASSHPKAASGIG
ncbi:MAG: oxygenase MpaB family protein [Actinomycetota bacterium]